jgi:hypothetical protein
VPGPDGALAVALTFEDQDLDPGIVDQIEMVRTKPVTAAFIAP